MTGSWEDQLVEERDRFREENATLHSANELQAAEINRLREFLSGLAYRLDGEGWKTTAIQIRNVLRGPNASTGNQSSEEAT